jgi:dolichol kinase
MYCVSKNSDMSSSDTKSCEISYNNSTYIGPFTDKLYKEFVQEIKKEKYKKTLMKNIIEPILDDLNKKYYSHIIFFISMLILIILLLIGLLSAIFMKVNVL